MGATDPQKAPTVPSMEGLTLSGETVDVAKLARGRPTVLLFGFRDAARVREAEKRVDGPTGVLRTDAPRAAVPRVHAQANLATFATPLRAAFGGDDRVGVYEVSRCAAGPWRRHAVG